MIRVTFKGILAHKVRFLLTGVAIILGVAFICGTLVFTATINKAFDGLFTNVYQNTDAVVRERATFQASDSLVWARNVVPFAERSVWG